MARKPFDYDTYEPDAGGHDRIPVKIGPKKKKKTFYARPMVTGISLLDLVSEFDSENEATAALAMRRFLENAMEDWESFKEFISDPDNFVDFDLLSRICLDLAEEYMGGVPTESAQSSSDGSAGNGSGSKEKQSSTAST